jgi:hypothetical protein
VAKTAVTDEREPLNLQKRIDSPGALPALNGRHWRPAPTFIINVETSPFATETAELKILRLIEREVRSYD